MKTTAFGVFSLLIITLSCQSEYERQLATGKDIVEQQVKGTAQLKQTTASAALQDELEVCAHVSGNKRLFMLEMKNYREELEQTRMAKQQLITKFP